MKESHIEGVASHDGPESGTCTREGICEARTGVRAVGVLSREKGNFGVPTPSTFAEGNTGMCKKGKCMADPARSKTSGMYGNSMRENRESLCLSYDDGA